MTDPGRDASQHPGGSAPPPRRPLSGAREHAPGAWDIARGVWELARPHACAVGIVGTAGSLALLRPSSLDPSGVFLLPAAVGLMVAGANALNDVFDLEVDRLNAPARPLPSGRVRPRTAAGLAAAAFAASAALSALAGPRALALSLVQASALALYAWGSKRMGPAKNPFFAAYCASAFASPAIALGRWTPLLCPLTACCFAAMLAIEIMKDVADLEGDRALGARTLPALLGRRGAVWAAFAVLLLAWPAALAPVIMGLARPHALAFLVPAAVLCAVPFSKEPPPPSSKAFILAGTLVGFAGFLLFRA